ncbi:MAG: hypothetical protein M1820_001794 [Bogoriella megaspora]|nr:MAG: hypothetical protein M1820_001794 [Bogoriella megaspora]
MHGQMCLSLWLGLLSTTATAADVFAHFMVQNSYSYNQTTWEHDMQSASSVGIDGFALNWVPPQCNSVDPKKDLSWQLDRINNAYDAAETQDFKLFLSFDMSYGMGTGNCPTNAAWTEKYMASVVANHSSSSAAYKWNGDDLVTTYAGDDYGNAFFQDLKTQLKASGVSAAVAPAFTQMAYAAQNEDPEEQINDWATTFGALDGFFNWQSWPLNVAKNSTAAVDVALQSALKGAGKTGPYIMGISPWQFKDLNDGNKMDSWVMYSDYLFNDRWSAAVNTVHPDIIEIQTWNDWGESHYIRDQPANWESGPASAQLGDMEAYVNNTSHSPWRIITNYYATWYKTGSPPPISEDQVVYWYRRHPKTASCSGGNIRNADLVSDAVFAWALVQDTANITMTAGSNSLWTFEADGSGPKMGMVPFPDDLGDGVIPEITISRGDEHISGNMSVQITGDCEYMNFNPVVGLVGNGDKIKLRNQVLKYTKVSA